MNHRRGALIRAPRQPCRCSILNSVDSGRPRQRAGENVARRPFEPPSGSLSHSRIAPVILAAVGVFRPGRIGETEDVGRAAVWLASDESDYVTGTSLYVDGGMTLYPEFADGG